jgi:hypothetical protein
LIFACSSSDSSGFGGAPSIPPTNSPGGNGGAPWLGGADASAFADAGGDAYVLPPETKVEGQYQAPVATGQVVWIANPTSGRVAYIDTRTLDVKTIEAGDGPTYLAAVPDPMDDVAIVANVRSHDATLLRDHSQTITSQTFPLTADANSWAISANGRWAIAWTDATRVSTADPTQGFQDIAVLDLSGARPATILAVGYRPTKVAFSSDGGRAFAVTQDGISVVDLLGGAQPTVVQNFPLTAPPPAPAQSPVDAAPLPEAGADAAEGAANSPGAAGTTNRAPDVSITPDGAFALVRQEGVPTVSVVSLQSGASARVSLPAPPTDLALSPKGDFALAVLRDISSVAVLPVPGIASAPASYSTTAIPGETVGRAVITNGGASALLFTTAAAVPRMVILTMQPSPSVRVVELHSPVMAVFPTDDARNAIVLHAVTPDPTSHVLGAFSVVPLAGTLPGKIVGTPAPPTAVALAPAGDRALIAVRDDTSSTYGMYLAKMPSLEVLPYALASPPIAAGVAASAARGYVAQDYPEGRITLVDLAAGQARTITGFELGARVVDGSQP